MDPYPETLTRKLAALQTSLDVMSGAQVAMAVAMNLMLASYRQHPEMAKALDAELELAYLRMLANTSSDAKIEGFELIAKGLRKALE